MASEHVFTFADIVIKNLEKKAKKKELTIKDCGGGGECFFASLADQLIIRFGVSLTPLEIRKKAVNYLLENPRNVSDEHIGSFVEGTVEWLTILHQKGLLEGTEAWYEALLELYAQNMLKSTTWADNIIINAAVDSLQYDLVIVSSNIYYEDVILKCKGSHAHVDTLTIGHIKELHYVSLQPLCTEEATEGEPEDKTARPYKKRKLNNAK